MDEAKVFAQLKVDAYGNSTSEVFSAWNGAEVGEATLIYDSTGFPVLYEVEVLNGIENVGTIEIWSDKALGTPYCGIKLPALTPSTAKMPSIGDEKVKEEFVYYNYPKKAYKVEIEVPNKNSEKTILIDVNTQKVITKDQQHSFRELIKEENITTNWEYWSDLLNSYREYRMPPDPEIIVEMLNVQHYIQEDLINQSYHNLGYNFCVSACAQMILDYHNDIILSQYELGNCYFIPAEETTCTGAGLDGVAYDDVVPGWNRLGYTNSTRINSPLTIGATRDEIDLGYPFMVPYGGIHMETANGYVTGWNVQSEVHLLNPAFPSNNSNSSFFISLPSVNISFYYTIR